MKRKGIILAGGSGTRLYPATLAISKQLLPVFDKPMIYYPLCTLMIAGIRDIILISTPRDLPLFKELLGDGSRLGINLDYESQAFPGGLAEALIIADSFLSGDSSALILGDNIFYGPEFDLALGSANSQLQGATIFAYEVNDPERYGVVSFDRNGKATGILEKPKNPPSNFAVTGLYFYDETAPQYAREVQPSKRGELEITDVNLRYLDAGMLSVEVVGRGNAWLDTGTHESLIEANQFVQTIENRQGIKIACPEEIAFKRGWIGEGQMHRAIELQKNNSYGRYLGRLLDEH